jgi:hypothetical protein
MEIDAFFIADHVAAPPDGKFYVQGAAFSRVEVSGLPTPLNLGVVALLRVSEAEAGEEHRVRITLFGPTEMPNVDAIEGVTQPQEISGQLDGEEIFIQIAVMIPGIAVREGLHQVELVVDDQMIRRIPLPVMVRPADVDQPELSR